MFRCTVLTFCSNKLIAYFSTFNIDENLWTTFCVNEPVVIWYELYNIGCVVKTFFKLLYRVHIHFLFEDTFSCTRWYKSLPCTVLSFWNNDIICRFNLKLFFYFAWDRVSGIKANPLKLLHIFVSFIYKQCSKLTPKIKTVFSFWDTRCKNW